LHTSVDEFTRVKPVSHLRSIWQIFSKRSIKWYATGCMMDRYALYVIHSTLLQLTVLNIWNRAHDRSSNSFRAYRNVAFINRAIWKIKRLNRIKKKMHCVISYLFYLFIYYSNKLCFLHINKKYNIFIVEKY